MKKTNETKTAPAGHYYTKSGNLVKGKLTKDAEERGARKSDPKDKMRSKTPPVTQNNPTEMNNGSITTADSREAEMLAKKGIDVKLADKIEEQDSIVYSELEVKRIAGEVGKALNKSLEEIGDEVVGMKVRGIESDPNGGSFDLIVQYKQDNREDEFSFYVSGKELHLADFTFDKVVGEVGVLPSGKPLVNRDIIKNNLVKHFRSKYLEEKKARDVDGDGDIDSDDYLAARNKAIEKNMNKQDSNEVTEQESENAMDTEGNELFIGDIIELEGTGRMFRTSIGESGVVVLQEVEMKDGNYVNKDTGIIVRGGTPLFEKIIKKSRRVVAFRDVDFANEDIDIGHRDDEPDMLKQYVYDTAVYAAKLYKQLNRYSKMGTDVDFPNWWQAKIIRSKDLISSAQHYLEFEEKQPALDAMALEERRKKHISEESQSFRLMAERLLSTLSDAIDIAEKTGMAVNLDRDAVADDPEAMSYTNKVEDSLKRIYNGYMTGDRFGDREDEIFKEAKKEENDSHLSNNKQEATLSYGSDYDDPYDDYNAENAAYAEAERLYDAGYELYKDGVKANDQERINNAEKMRLQALHLASDWDERELPPYNMLNEAKATCCHRCGRKHVKGTPCKKPYLAKSDPRHCANK